MTKAIQEASDVHLFCHPELLHKIIVKIKDKCNGAGKNCRRRNKYVVKIVEND